MTRPIERLSASHRPRTSFIPRPAWALVVGMLAGWASPCPAALIVSAPDIQAAPGSSGSFDLLITNDASGPSFNVAGFNLNFVLAGGPGVQFTGVTIGTTTSYVFVTSATTFPGADPLSTDPFPNTGFTATDAEFAPPDFFRTIAPGETFGLAHVSYSVSALASPGNRTLEFGVDTTLSDEVGDSIPFSLANGTIEVLPLAVPEPSTLMMAALGGVTVLLTRRGLGRRAVPAPGEACAGSAG